MLLLLLVPLVQCCYSLFNVATPFDAPYSTLLLLADVVANLVTPPLAISCSILLFFAFWSTLLFLCLFVCSFLLHCDVVVPLFFVWLYCCSSFYFKLVLPPPLFFCNCGRSYPNSSFKLDLEGENFFSIFVCWWIFFVIHVVFRKFWLTMCLFVVCKIHLDIIHLIIHIAFHLHRCIVYLFSTLHLFFVFLQLLINV